MAVCVLSCGDLNLTENELKNAGLHDKFKSSSLLIFGKVGQEKRQFSIEDKALSQKLHLFHAESTIDAIFKAKRCMDEAKIVEGAIFVPADNFRECSAVKELLFVHTFDVSVQTFPVNGVLETWDTEPDGYDFAKGVREYLRGVPSREDIKTIQSRMLPSTIFVHGFTTRKGGVSFYPSQASINMVCSTRKTDSKFVIEENRRRLCAHIGCDCDRFEMAKAVHGADIWVYEKAAPESYDGIVTQTPGVTVASPAADCNMLLLADPVKKCCGSVHAGWKGILAGVVPAAVKAMVEEYGSDPKDILCCYGPSLSVCCLEFGAEDSKKFRAVSDDVIVWKEGREKPHIDIRLAAKIQLKNSGIKAENIDDGVTGSNPTPVLATCTKCDPDASHFSYRRDGAKFGNGCGYISIK